MNLEPDMSFWGTWGKPPRGSGPDAGAVDARADSGPTPGTSTGAAVAPALANAIEREKRRSPRFRCEGNMELKTEGSTIRTWATFTEVSASGCYVEMMTTFPVGTKMELQLGMNGFLVNGEAVVRVTYPFLGMGIEFTNLSQNAREQLDDMVASLNMFALRRAEAAAKRDMVLPPVSEPAAVIDALVQYFETHAALSSEEFVRLVADSQQRSS